MYCVESPDTERSSPNYLLPPPHTHTHTYTHTAAHLFVLTHKHLRKGRSTGTARQVLKEIAE